MDLSSKELFCFTVDTGTPIRLDKFLAEQKTDFSRTVYQEHIHQGLVQVNQVTQTKVSFLLKAGDQVTLQLQQQEEPLQLDPEPIPLKKIYEDDMVLIIDKPRDMVVHPAPGHYHGTVAHAILYEIGERLRQEFPEEPWRPGIVHRLDKDTSGLLITAKTRQAKALYSELFAQKRLKKTYVAICQGLPKETYIHTHIARHATKRKEMAVVQEGGKEAITHCEVVAFNGKLSVVLLSPETGRTHQLRVHMKHIGTPILGDPVYGSSNLNSSYNLDKQQLHAYSLIFNHPRTQAHLQLTTDLPEDMQVIITKEFQSSKALIIKRLSQFI